MSKRRTYLELKQAFETCKDLLWQIRERFFYLDHLEDDRLSGFYMKENLTDPVGYDTNEVLDMIDEFLLEEDGEMTERILRTILAKRHKHAKERIVIENSEHRLDMIDDQNKVVN